MTQGKIVNTGGSIQTQMSFGSNRLLIDHLDLIAKLRADLRENTEPNVCAYLRTLIKQLESFKRR